MRIKDYNDMMGHLLRKGTPEQAKRAEENNRKYLADRKAKTLKYYGLDKTLIDPQHFVNVSNTYDGTNYIVDENGQITDEETLKKKFENEVTAKTKELSEDKIVTKQKPSSKKPILKDRPVRKPKAVPPKTKTVKTATNPVIDFTPIDLDLDTYKADAELDLVKKRIDEMQEQSKQEKLKNQNSGIGYLVGGSKAYE
jgi:hypothetical protein